MHLCPHPAHRGRLPEASWRWSRVRRPRTGLAHLDPGGLRTPLGRHYERPARSWLTSGRKWLDEKRGPRTEIAAVERREARRSWTGDLRRNGDRPDREAGHAVRRSAPAPSRRSAPLASVEGESTASLGAHALARPRWAV